MDPILSGISLRDVGTALLDLAMPRRCVVCRRPLGLRERFICLDCLADLPLTHFWERSHNPMADAFNARIQEDLDVALAPSSSAPALTAPAASSVEPSASGFSDPVASSVAPCASGFSGPAASSSHSESSCRPECNEESSAFEPYAFAAALFFYNADSDYRRIPWHLKYEGGLAAGRYFARMLGVRLAASPQFADVDVVIPVPLHWTRRWRSRASSRMSSEQSSARTSSAARAAPAPRSASPWRPSPPTSAAPSPSPAGYPEKRPTLRANTRRVPPKTAYPAGKHPQGTSKNALPCGQTPAGDQQNGLTLRVMSF